MKVSYLTKGLSDWSYSSRMDPSQTSFNGTYPRLREHWYDRTSISCGFSRVSSCLAAWHPSLRNAEIKAAVFWKTSCVGFWIRDQESLSCLILSWISSRLAFWCGTVHLSIFAEGHIFEPWPYFGFNRQTIIYISRYIHVACDLIHGTCAPSSSTKMAQKTSSPNFVRPPGLPCEYAKSLAGFRQLLGSCRNRYPTAPVSVPVDGYSTCADMSSKTLSTDNLVLRLMETDFRTSVGAGTSINWAGMWIGRKPEMGTMSCPPLPGGSGFRSSENAR